MTTELTKDVSCSAHILVVCSGILERRVFMVALFNQKGIHIIVGLWRWKGTGNLYILWLPEKNKSGEKQLNKKAGGALNYPLKKQGGQLDNK